MTTIDNKNSMTWKFCSEDGFYTVRLLPGNINWHVKAMFVGHRFITTAEGPNLEETIEEASRHSLSQRDNYLHAMKTRYG